MNTETTVENQAIAEAAATALTLPQRAAVALGESANEAKLRELVAKSAGILTVTNADGRAEAHRAGMVLVKTGTSITSTGKAAREDATAFSKAVIAMEKELIAIIEPEKLRLLALRDAFDEQEAAEKAAKILAERQRMESIQNAIQAIRDLPLIAVGKTSSEISAMIGGLVSREPDASFEEFIEQAKAARHEALDKLAAMETAQRAIECESEGKRQEAARIAAEAEAARIAEIARIEAERAELARIAAEQAVEAKRLADLAAAQEATAKAERETIAAERAKVNAELIAAQEKIYAQIAALEAAHKLEVDHAEAIPMNEQFDADAAADLARCNATAEALLADARLPPPESVCERDAMIDAGFTEEPTDKEIIENYVESFGGTNEQAFMRILRMVMDAVDPTGDMMRARLAA